MDHLEKIFFLIPKNIVEFSSDFSLGKNFLISKTVEQ